MAKRSCSQPRHGLEWMIKLSVVPAFLSCMLDNGQYVCHVWPLTAMCIAIRIVHPLSAPRPGNNFFSR